MLKRKTKAIQIAQKGSLYLTRLTLFDYVATTEELQLSADTWFEQLGNDFQLRRSTKFSLKQAAAAHEALESRQRSGSIVLVPC